MYNILVCSFIIPLFSASFPVADVVTVDSVKNERCVHTAEEALRKAVKIAGFTEVASFREANLTTDMVGMVSIRDAMTDFWSDGSVARRAWRVSLPTLTLDIRRTGQVPRPGARSEYTKDFDIYIDSVTGKILRIQTRPDESDSAQLLTPTEADAEQQIRGLGEGYYGIPDTEPLITFLQALDKCKFYYLLAQKIVAVYVMHSYSTLEGEPRPAWVITLSGGLPYYSPHAGVPEHALMNRRTIVDATTGERVYSTNVPFAVPKDSAR